VIGWVWVIMGGFMFFSAVMALISSSIIGDMAQVDPNMPFFLKVFPFIAAVQIIVAVVGLISGISFLRLKSWSRNALEMLTWSLIVLIVCFGVFFISHFFSASSANSNFGFGMIELGFMIMIMGMYGIPMVIMVKYLRGEKVKSAMISPDKHSGGEGRT
jgi:uncharacterized membrane protein YozB (DUF420 family)